MRLTRIKFAGIVLVVMVVVTLTAWSASSPPVLTVRSQSQLDSTLFSYARSFSTQNFTDGSGIYTFKFGFDYPNTTVSQGERIELGIYCALVNQQITSPFTRGIALNLQSGSLLVNNREDSSIKIVSKTQPGLQAYYIQNPNTNIPLGSYNITARLLLETIDDNYVGNLQGTLQVVNLNGVLNITSSPT